MPTQDIVLLHLTNATHKPQDNPGSTLEWIALETASIIFSLASFYFLVAAIVYECKAKRMSLPHAQREWPNTMMSLSIPTGHSFLFVGFAIIQLPMLSDQYIACKVYVVAATWCQNLGVAAIFMMLWFRIRLFYSHSVMKTLQTKCNLYVGYATAAIVLGGAIQLGVIFSLINEVSPHERYVCTLIYVGKATLPSLIFMATSSSLCAVTLGALLILPLWRNRKSLSQKTAKDIRALSKRITITTVLCILLYVAAPVVVTTIRHRNNIVPNLIYDVMQLLNALIITLSFADWRTRFFPFCCLAPTLHRERSNSAMTRSVTVTSLSHAMPEAEVTSL